MGCDNELMPQQTQIDESLKSLSHDNNLITSSFYRKLALYQEVIPLNRIFKVNVRQMVDGGSKDTWEIEKKILYWTKFGHKHLGSSLSADEFKGNNQRLKDTQLTESEVQDIKGGGQYWLMNLVQKGYAFSDGRGIIISQKGLLMGRVLNDIYRLKRIDDLVIFNKAFWNIYADKYGAQFFLAKRFRYWLYALFIVVGWTLFLIATGVVIWAIIAKLR